MDDGSVCNSSCPGNSLELCGGSWAINVWSDYPSTGCFGDGNGPGIGDGRARLLSRLIYSSTVGSTVENCQAACSANGYAFAGVEAGKDCWCDSRLRDNAPSRHSLHTLSAICSSACTGDSSEHCGGTYEIYV